jgi:predicted PhzF superfamily epimerase YddE/YHI9
MMRTYKVVDVFTSTPLLGNPVAVVLDTKGRVGRSGRITVHIAPDGAVQIGGHCVTTVEGTLKR